MAKKQKQIGGRMGFFDDLELDLETPLQPVSDMASGVTEAAGDLLKDIFGKSETKEEKKKFESTGEIANFQVSQAAKEEEEKDEKEQLQQKLNQARTQIVTQEEIIYDTQQKIKAQREFTRLVGSALTSDEKNNLLHVSIDYAEKNIDNPYHLVNLRNKLKEQMDEQQKAKEAQEVQETKGSSKKGGIDLNKVAEGGQAQLSTTGGGGVG